MTTNDKYVKIIDRVKAITEELDRLHEEMLELGHKMLQEETDDSS